MMRPAGKNREIQGRPQVRDLCKVFFQGPPVEGVVAGAVVVGEDGDAAWAQQARRPGRQPRPFALE